MQQIGASSANILVVDDNLDNLRLLSKILIQEGYAVRSVTNGKLALITVDAAPPDLILLDVNMPELTGYEVCQQLKSNEKTAEIPVIFISAFSDTKDKVKAFQVGGVDYITKPFQVEEVLARVRNHLNLKRMQEQLRSQNQLLQQEINDRKAIESQLREAESKYRSIFENAIEGIFQTTPDGRYLNINPALARMYGYSSPEEAMAALVNIDTQLYVKPRRRLEFVTAIERNDIVTNFESQVYHRDGRVIWISEAAHAVRDTEGKIIYYEGTVSDITKRKQADDTLQRINSQLVAQYETAIDGILAVDEQGRIVNYNFRFCQMWGIAPEILQECDSGLIAYLSAQANIPRKLIAVIEGAYDRADRFDRGEIQMDDGRVLDYYSGRIISPDGHFYGIVWYFHDITELVEAREKAIEASKYKSRFLANMSHEIRTPMNGVMSMTELLQKTLLSTEQQDYLHTLRVSGENLLLIIDDILDLSKLEAREMHLESLDFDPVNSVEAVADLLAPQANAKGIELFTLLDTNLPALLRGDPTRLRQVIMNLVGNAIKFTERGEVQIQASLYDTTDTTVTVSFTIKDTGIGIASENQKLLFQPFTQVDASTTRRYGGTGLGLAICRQLVEMMGGNIQVKSEVGRGSAFSFTATFEKSQEQSANTSIFQIRPQLEHRRVLIVDVHPTSRRVLSNYALTWGMSVTEFDRIDLAFNSLDRLAAMGQYFDIALIGLDELDNCRELLGKLGQLSPGSHCTHSIIYTSIGNRETAINLVENDCAYAYLIKPIRASRLLECLIGALDTGTAVSPSVTKTSIPNDDTQHAEDLLANLKILIVEDNPVNQKVAIRQLKTLGCTQVSNTANGQEALALLKDHDFDIILMDCQMPVLDGYQTTQAIRQLERGAKRKTVVIGLTANAMKGDRERCLASGMNDYLSKPVALDELSAMLRTWSNRRS
ncbi:response regulator [Pseudanabaena sp. PCC 6802]|uniref:response regulator n=1 Tax=Pseudanabaena sp. PCC 6802 TaxID=118173 RepID=UPI00034C5F25|nr:response regulator [Pseudanabaena sp. PCC 6802]